MLDVIERALALRAAPLFGPLPADALVPVAQLCREHELAPDEVLFEEGELGEAMYVVVSGRVSVERDDRRVAELGPGECVGELAALDREPRSARVRALEPTRLVRLDRNDLMDLLADYPELVRALAAVLVERLRSTRR